MRKKQSGCIALCGVMCGLAVIVMSSGSIIPFATFCAPAVAGILLIPVAIKCGMRLGWTCYAAVSVLAVLLVPDKEIAAVFVFFLGYYPLCKAYLERIRTKILQGAAKLAVFNGSILLMYWVLLRLFSVQYLVQEFSEMGQLFTACLLVLANVCFIMYDLMLRNLLVLYMVKIKPRFKNLF